MTLFKYLAARTASSDALRYSTRKRAVTNYNEDNAELWGLSENEDDTFGDNSYTPQPEEEEGDVIESIHDHRRREEFGNEITLIYPYNCLLQSLNFQRKRKQKKRKKQKQQKSEKPIFNFPCFLFLIYIYMYDIYMYMYIHIIKLINQYSE